MSLVDIGLIYCEVVDKKVCIKPKGYTNIQTIGDGIIRSIASYSYTCSYCKCPYSKILSKANCTTINNYLNDFLN